jgi:hypothetical protein
MKYPWRYSGRERISFRRMSKTAPSSAKNRKNAWPAHLYVSGMPLLLIGFNGAYDFCGTDEQPEWERPAHTFLGISIRPTKIVYENGKWVLKADDFLESVFCQYRMTKAVPLGYWPNSGIYVSEESGSMRQTLNPYGLIVVVGVLLISLIIYLVTMIIPSVVHKVKTKIGEPIPAGMTYGEAYWLPILLMTSMVLLSFLCLLPPFRLVPPPHYN